MFITIDQYDFIRSGHFNTIITTLIAYEIIVAIIAPARPMSGINRKLRRIHSTARTTAAYDVIFTPSTLTEFNN
jgi:hypothetical protein